MTIIGLGTSKMIVITQKLVDISSSLSCSEDSSVRAEATAIFVEGWFISN